MHQAFPDEAPSALQELSRYVMADEKMFCERDARATYSEITISEDGELSGSLPVVLVDKIETFSLGFRRHLGVADLTGRLLVVGGGLAQSRAGVWTRAVDSTGRAQAIRELVGKALVMARSEAARPISLFVPEADLGAFEEGTSRPALTQRQAKWCELSLSGARTFDEFLCTQPRKARQTWRRDERDAERLKLTYEVTDFSESNTAAAVPLIAEVLRRNDMPEHERIVRRRMQAFQYRPGCHFYIRTLDSCGTIGYTACRIWGSTLDAHTVGIDASATDRRSAYHYAGFMATLLVALEKGLSKIEYGATHEHPKLVRGCAAVDMWKVDFSGLSKIGLVGPSRSSWTGRIIIAICSSSYLIPPAGPLRGLGAPR
jgi:hypothetical protein